MHQKISINYIQCVQQCGILAYLFILEKNIKFKFVTYQNIKDVECSPKKNQHEYFPI